MPRYFFDLKNGHLIPDVLGLDLSNDDAAAQQGVAVADQIKQDIPDGDVRRRVVVVKEDGKEVASIKIRKRSNGNQ